MNQQIQNDVNKTLEELIRQFSFIDDQKINIIPFPGSWTAGQLAQHMILSNSGFADLITGPATETARKPDQHVEDFRFLLNFTTKFESPEFVRPEPTTYRKNEQLDALVEIKANLYKILGDSDLTRTCTSFDLPGTGLITGLEAAHFVLYHTQRHIHQLKNIAAALDNQPASMEIR